MKLQDGYGRKPANFVQFAKSIGIAAMMFAGVQGANAGSMGAYTDTYAGDISGLELPVGVFIVSNYVAARHQSALYDNAGNREPGSFNVYLNTFRVDWRADDIFEHPLVLSFAAYYGSPQNIDTPTLPNSDGVSTFFAPTIYATLGLIVDQKNERDLALSNFIVLPGGNYDPAKSINLAAPDQMTDIVQLTYQEGLRKFSPALKNFWFDAWAAVGFHSDGSNPVSMAGFGFDKLTQRNTYNAAAFLRYNWSILGFAAAGIEKSWGGEQVAKGGMLELLNGGPMSLSKDDYVKGHIQFGIPLSERMQLAGDITHDFYRAGGFKEDFTAEVRIMKIFAPSLGLEETPAN